MCAVLVAGGKILDATVQPALGASQTWWWAVGALGVAAVFAGKFAQLRQEVSSQVREENRVRRRFLEAAFRLGPARVKRDQLGRLVSLGTQSAQRFTIYLQSFLPQVKASFTAPILLLVAMGVFVHPLLAIAMVVCLPLIPLGIGGFMKVFRRSSSGSTRARSALAAAYLDALGGLTTLQLLGASGRIGKELEAKGEENRRATMRLLRSNQIVIFVLDAVFSLFALTACATVLLHLALSQDITPGQAFTGLGLALLLLEPIEHFGAFFYIAMGGRGAGRGLWGFLRSAGRQAETERDLPSNPPESDRRNPQIRERLGGNQPAASQNFADEPCAMASSEENGAPACTGGETAPACTGGEAAIRLENLSFSYEKKPLLRAVNLVVEPGSRIAIVGASGQGKTTLLHLMKGFLTSREGMIAVNGTTRHLTEQSALVSQRTWLFTGTLRENLAAVAPHASESDLWRALEAAHIDAEIRALSAGLDTTLGENGRGMSTGQKQRLSLARAFASGRKILLLDEATSQVDLASEREILAALSGLGREYTLVMVTHRQEVLRLADRVLVLANGQVKSRE